MGSNNWEKEPQEEQELIRGIKIIEINRSTELFLKVIKDFN